MPRRAADLMIECLRAQGADRLFCVPGESYLALLDALLGSEIDLVVCRHEGGAAMAAVADAKLTGRPGLVACSRGPGAANAAIGVHLAEQDAVPLVVLVGQVARWERGRGAFQEVDYGQMFGGVAKMVREVTEAAQLPETIARAFHVARAGTPGPVVVVLPEDVLSDATDAPVVPAQPVARMGPPAEAVDAAAAMLARSARPLVIAGGGLASPEGRAALARMAAAHGLPVAATFKHQDVFGNASPLFAGHLGFKVPPGYRDALARADLILAVGTRLGDTPTQGWRLPRAPVPDQPLIHVWPDPEVLGRVFATDLALPCDPAAFCEALAARPRGADVSAWAAEAHGAAARLMGYEVRTFEDGLDFGAVALSLARQAPPGAIVVTDSGNFSSWIHRVWPWDGATPAIGAAGGAMGLGVPGAVAACLRHPDRTVICVTGDGGALMTGAELATAAACGARPKVVICDNGAYGTIRLHQERAYPGRVSGTELANPNFAAWGRSFGALGLAVAARTEVDEAVARLLAHEGPAVLHVRASLEAISAQTTLTALRHS